MKRNYTSVDKLKSRKPSFAREEEGENKNLLIIETNIINMFR